MKKHILILLLALAPVLAFGQAGKVKQANQDTQAWRYEIEPVTVGLQGTVVIRVWSFSKNPVIAGEQAKKNAVHGVMFKGIPTLERMPGKKPLVTPEEEANSQQFLDQFFADGGDYMRYVSLTNSAGGEEVLKVGKEYKVGVVVAVSYNELRSYLESKAVIRSLDAGF